MDDIRGSFSKMKKKAKHRLGLTGKKYTPDGMAANPGGEGPDSTSSLPQPESHVVVGGSYDGEGDKADPAGEPDFSTGPPPQPDGLESVPARGDDDGQEGEGADDDRGDPTGQNPHSDSEIEVESGSSRESEWFSLSGSAPSLSLHGGEPDGT